MADFIGRKRGKSHVQNMGIFFGGSGHGSESSCQISAYYKFFPGLHVFCRISIGLIGKIRSMISWKSSMRDRKIFKLYTNFFSPQKRETIA